MGSPSKEFKRIPRRYLKFGVVYFPLWILCSWVVYEAMFPHFIYSLAERVLRSGILALGFSLLLLAITGIPSFLLLRRKDVGFKGKILMSIVIVAMASVLIPQAYFSHINKIRLQGYIKNLEYLTPFLGFKVEYVDHFAYGHWIPTWVENYNEFIEIIKTVEPDVVTISAGVPYHFVFFFPKTIEMICAVPYNGFYILRIE